ncbi:MAG: single-stranded DNA-binding protein [Oscillospiraceae bacterium]
MANATINLIGRVVNEPEIREGKDQRKFVTFRLAVNNQFGASETAAFYNCTGNEFMANRVRKAGLKKGRLIYVTGSFNPREYQTKNGEVRMSLDVGLYDWVYTGGKPKSEEDSAAASPNNQPKGVVHPESTIGDEDDLPL